MFQSFGEFLQSVANAAENPNYPRVGGGLEYQVISGLGSTEGTEGAYLVPTEFAADLLEKVYATGRLLAMCNKFPMRKRSLKIPTVNETSRANGSRFGGLALSWTDEGEALPTSNPAFGEREMALHKLAGILHVTDELLQDAPALGAIMTRLFSLEASFVLEDEIINGNGVGRPLGIMNGAALVSIAKESGQGADTIVSENIWNMWSRLWAPSKARAVWLVGTGVAPQLYDLSTRNGAALFRWADDGPRLLGRPLISTEYNAQLGDKGDIALVDLGEYLLADREVETTSSIHVRFLNDEVAFKFILRTDGMPAWSSATTPKNSAATVSPFVSLDERA